ncbi:MAG: hypothetical protein PHD05_08220, partial [Sphaerochaetaceae bacterium]|nr:hypothetical protein [Sphaerochaetaceae bacterium]
MKRFLFIALLLVALLFISCDLFITPSGEETLEISVGTTSGSTSRGSKVPATIFNDLNVNSVKARIFYNSDGVLVPSGSLTLTKTTTNWHGRFEYNPGDITGNVIIHIMGFSGSDGTGAIIWQGSTTSQLITAFENGTVTVPTTHGYDVGNRGPGGGWIIYDKTTFDDTGSKMGKDWRYIEIAAEDLEEDWTSDLIDEASYYVSPTDKKVYRKSDNVLTLDTTDFYWGQAGNFNTLVATQEGKLNTGILVDDMT